MEIGREPGEAFSALSGEELRAARALVARIRQEVPAELVQASLFGSKARGEARPDSDVDLLLVFRRLAPDREPHASHAEAIAEEVAAASGVPVTVWSVSLIDLEPGNRTPMLVDALTDSIPLWFRESPLPVVPFTPPDALRCAGALLQRVDEGAEELAAHLAGGDALAAARRVRDDVVRLCTATLLMHGVTRPRRAAAVREFRRRELDAATPAPVRRVLRWAEASFGPLGKDEEAEVAVPGTGLRCAAAVVEALRRGVARRAARLRASLDGEESWPASRISMREWSLRS